ncbi:MAG: hypothetical protein AABY22_08470 [Nanoarchaeota archaeon]
MDYNKLLKDYLTEIESFTDVKVTDWTDRAEHVQIDFIHNENMQERRYAVSIFDLTTFVYSKIKTP